MRQSIAASIAALIRSTLADRRGNAAVLVGLALLVMIGAAGVSIDLGRGYIAKTKLQTSLDSAGLAAGSEVGPNSTALQVRDQSRKYLDANFSGDTIGANITNFTVGLRSSNTIIDLNATAQLPTTFMRLFGRETMTVSAATEITRRIDGLELVLALDVTESMSLGGVGGGTRIAALRSAGVVLVDTLFNAAPAGTNLWVGVVPFSQAVNIGPTRHTWIDPVGHAALPWDPSHPWGGCVEERLGGMDVDDTPPVGANRFQSYFWIIQLGNLDPMAPNTGCPVELRIMTDQRTDLVTMINALSTDGYTHINVGAVWGWRMLSPRWRGEWGAAMNANSLPHDYHTAGWRKAVVLMSDGTNEMPHSTTVGAGAPYTAYRLLSHNRLGTTCDVIASKATLDVKTRQVCNAMKANGIVIYSVAFGPAVTGTSIDLLRSCASEEDFFFHSPTAAQLEAAFRTIAISLSNLRISR
jgi:Flp pilus assembly protein TadG